MVAYSEDVQQTDGSRAFWSPLFVLLLGTPVAALNWWRMGWKRKAITFLCVSIVIALLQVWLRHGTPYTDKDTSGMSIFLIFLPLLVALAYNLIVALIVFYDMQAFHHSGMTPRAVNWTIIFAFVLSTTLISFAIVSSLDYFAKTTRYCHFPRFQDLRYDIEIDARSELRTTLINHYDSGCNVWWGMESESTFLMQNQVPRPVNSILYTLVGRQRGNSTSFISMHQVVELYTEPITQATVDSQVEHKDDGNLSLEIPKDANHSSLTGYTCFQTEEYKNCIITLGYEHVLTRFEISQQGISDSEFKRILSEIIQATDQRIYEYEVSIQK